MVDGSTYLRRELLIRLVRAFDAGDLGRDGRAVLIDVFGVAVGKGQSACAGGIEGHVVVVGGCRVAFRQVG